MKHKTNSVETYRKETIWHNIRKFWPYYIMVIPGVIYFIIFKYIPLVGSVIAFQDYSIIKGIGASNWVGLENFKNYFHIQISRESCPIRSYLDYVKRC